MVMQVAPLSGSGFVQILPALDTDDRQSELESFTPDGGVSQAEDVVNWFFSSRFARSGARWISAPEAEIKAELVAEINVTVEDKSIDAGKPRGFVVSIGISGGLPEFTL